MRRSMFLATLLLLGCDDEPACAQALRDYDACVAEAMTVDDLYACHLAHLPSSLDSVGYLNTEGVEGSLDMRDVQYAAEARLMCE